MATSAVTISNLALSRLGQDANIASLDPPEGSANAELCAQFYPIALDTLLEMHPWKFAVRRTQPALRDDLANGAWAYPYQEPNGCVRVLGVLADGYTSDQDAQAFETESDADGNGIILTNTEDATVRYIARVTNPAKFTPLFVEALSWLLASMVAGPIIKGETGAAEGIRTYQAFLAMYARASGSSANQMKKRLEHTPDWIAARG